MTGKRTRRRLEIKPPPPGITVDERKRLLVALLREARRAKSLTVQDGNNILEHTCVLRKSLTTSELKEIGEALKKVAGSNPPLSEADFLS